MENWVRVGTYNLYLGANLGLLLGARPAEELAANRVEVGRQLTRTAFPARAGAVARVLARERLDLVGLQEVCRWDAEGGPLWDFTTELCGHLEQLGEPYDVVADQPTFDGGGTLPLEDREVAVRVRGSNTILRRRSSPVAVESAAVGVFDSALAVPAMGHVDYAIERGWCSALCAVAGRPEVRFTFANTHTEAYDQVSRDQQRDELLAALLHEQHPLVLVGDFNSVPERIGMPAPLRDAWVEAGNPTAPELSGTCGQAADLSNPLPQLRERIDYVWVRGVGVVSCHRFGVDPGDRTESGLWPSDHAGVAAVLELG